MITAFDTASTQSGTITSDGSGGLIYTPASGFTGTDSFTYTIAETDGDGSTATVTVTVNAANQAPLITTSAIVDAIDSQAAVIDIQATDDHDSEGKGLAYSLTGGADAALFAINAASGVLSFKAAPVYTSPQDANHDNMYDVQVTVTDSGGLTTFQDLAITVVPAPEFNQILGTDAGEDLIGHALRDRYMAIAATIGSMAKMKTTSSTAAPETTSWTAERASTPCMAGPATICTGSTIRATW